MEHARSHGQLSYRDAVSVVRSSPQPAVKVKDNNSQFPPLRTISSLTETRVLLLSLLVPRLTHLFVMHAFFLLFLLYLLNPLVSLLLCLSLCGFWTRLRLVPENKLMDVCALLNSELVSHAAVVPPGQSSSSPFVCNPRVAKPPVVPMFQDVACTSLCPLTLLLPLLLMILIPSIQN